MTPQAFTASSRCVWRSVDRGDEFFQQCATHEGAAALADLLNRAAVLVELHGSSIVSAETVARSKTGITPGSVVAHAVAKIFDWCLELPSDREARQQADREYAEQQSK